MTETDADSLHTAAANRSEEFLVLHTSNAPTRFKYEISEMTGVERIEQREGRLRFIGADGCGIQIEAPWVIDAKGRKDSKAVFWEMGAKAADGTQRLSLIMAPNDLGAALLGRLALIL